MAIRAKTKLNSTNVIDALMDLFIVRGAPTYIRLRQMVRSLALKPSGKGSRSWARNLCYIEIELGSTRENDYCEKFNACCKGELLNGEIFYIVSRFNREQAMETALHYETTASSHRIQTKRSPKL